MHQYLSRRKREVAHSEVVVQAVPQEHTAGVGQPPQPQVDRAHVVEVAPGSDRVQVL